MSDDEGRVRVILPEEVKTSSGVQQMTIIAMVMTYYQQLLAGNMATALIQTGKATAPTAERRHELAQATEEWFGQFFPGIKVVLDL